MSDPHYQIVYRTRWEGTIPYHIEVWDGGRWEILKVCSTYWGARLWVWWNTRRPQRKRKMEEIVWDSDIGRV